MIGGINLHAIVRPAINALHPDIKATLYQSIRQATCPDGGVKSIYAPGVSITAQMQSEGPGALYHADRVGMEEVGRKFYLFSTPELEKRVAGIVRPLSRGGDVFQLDDQTWWLVDAVLEDFTRSGWASVRATLQVKPPDFSASEWHTP
ncbi:MAG: hypothetical protein LBH65_04655 [Desulfovibrio sp.]|jgi:hypothetical protein|nr:hypothetical protein [Desulfovibrio sp.]